MTEKVRKTLIERLDSLVRDVEDVHEIQDQYGYVRYKPFFNTYNSCNEEFRSNYPDIYEQLSLEDLPLYDEQGNEQFTNVKISTLVRQSRDLLAVLRSMAPDQPPSSPKKITLHWLFTNVSWKVWSWLLILLFIAYMIGAKLGMPNWLNTLIDTIKEVKNIFL